MPNKVKVKIKNKTKRLPPREYGAQRDKSKPGNLHKDRILSKELMPAGKETCNAPLKSRDGYCQQHGLVEFQRCKHHDGVIPNQEAYDVFAKSLSIGDAAKLDKLIEDTLNMNNELASAKVMLTQCLEDLDRSRHIKKEFLENRPIAPEKDEDKVTNDKLLDNYRDALALHRDILGMASEMESTAYSRAEKLVKTLTEGIYKNKRLIEGTKFTMDVRQVRDIIKTQLEVMAVNCAECPKLRSVIKMMRERMKDISIEGNTKKHREILGAQKYEEELGRVDEIADALVNGELPTEEEEEDI